MGAGAGGGIASSRKAGNEMTNENERQFQVEAERSMATLEQAISTM